MSEDEEIAVLTQEIARSLANEVMGDMNKQPTPKRKQAAFESWVIWRLAVMQVALNGLFSNLEQLETRDRKGEGESDPGQDILPQ